MEQLRRSREEEAGEEVDEEGILELGCAVADEDDEEDDGDDDDDDDDDTTELKFVATSSHGNVFMAV